MEWRAHVDFARATSGPEFYTCAHCAKVPMLKQLLGHDGEPQLHRKNLVTGQPLTICPIRSLERAEESNPLLYAEVERAQFQLYPAYRDHGILPTAGGMYEQPARTMDYLMLLADYNRTMHQKFTPREDEEEL